MKKYRFELLLATCAACLLIYGGVLFLKEKNQLASEPASTQEASKSVIKKTRYGYDINEYHFEEYSITYGSFLGDILSDRGVSYNTIHSLEKAAEEIYSIRKIKAKKKITIIRKDECQTPMGFIYAPNLFTYVDFTFGDSIHVAVKELPFVTCREALSGTIEAGSSLSESMDDKGLSLAMTDELEDALAQVYFPNAQPGDQWKILYDQKYIEEKPVGSGKILAASYKRGNSEYFGFYFANDRYKGYYDIEGTPNKKTFLRAPVRASRISSFYNPNRFHPVLKRRKPHLGTDYAAAKGTEIFSVSDGVITKRGYTKGNGNYIKIKHNGVYQSQYLHMSRFKSGLSVGSRVRQGQVIGYVGSTGLATGNHVCFRFWKNGKQINHLRENFPPLDPMPDESLPAYYQVRDNYWRELSALPYEDETKLAYASSGLSI